MFYSSGTGRLCMQKESSTAEWELKLNGYEKTTQICIRVVL